MTNINPTPSELQRIDAGEKQYADGEWEICPCCHGGELSPGQKCHVCHGAGEIPRQDETLYEAIIKRINGHHRIIGCASNGQSVMAAQLCVQELDWVLKKMTAAEANQCATRLTK